MKYLLFYLLIINAAAFFLMLADKHKARKKKWRIPEATLLYTALFGGSLGCLIGMYAVRHKTKHLRFVLGVPMMLLLHILIMILLLRPV